MKQRYHTLDALRGVAAIAVFFHHSSAIAAPIRMPAGYRAVDLFFILSGFVLAHAYEQRLRGGLSLGEFMQARVIRLYPLYLLGLLIGAGGAFAAVVLHGGDMTMEQVVISTISMTVMMPSPATAALMPLNIPAWSLFFELLINLVYGCIAARLSNGRLHGIVAASALALIIVATHVGTSNIGDAWATFAGGVARVTFAFFAGVLLFRHRSSKLLTSSWAWVVPFASVPLLFYGQEVLFTDLACILIVFPALIWFGAKCEVPNRLSASILGDTSYGLYVLHVPVILFTYKAFSYSGSDANAFAPWTGLVILTVLIPAVYILDRVYDAPVRKLITGRLGAPNRKTMPSR